MPAEVDDLDASLNVVTLQPVDGADIYGTGLKNEIGEYNCFLNVIIQVSQKIFEISTGRSIFVWPSLARDLHFSL